MKSKRTKLIENRQAMIAFRRMSDYIRLNVLDVQTWQFGNRKYVIETYYNHLGIHKPNQKSSILARKEYNRPGSPIYRELKLQRPVSKKRKKTEYITYLGSNKWKSFKAGIINVRGQQCEECKSEGKVLDLHHKTYARLFNELPEDVMLLCRPCHEKVHSKKLIKG